VLKCDNIIDVEEHSACCDRSLMLTYIIVFGGIALLVMVVLLKMAKR